MFADMAIEELRGQIGHFCRLGDRVIDQARRRVLCGEQVATDEKIYSIFELHTDLISASQADSRRAIPETNPKTICPELAGPGALPHFVPNPSA
jgi:hypothetical protein